MNILNTIKDETKCIDLVHEYFAGKYSKEEVKTLLYEFHPLGNLTVRRGVSRLADEWAALKGHDTKTVENWYSSTDFYIFDLLPWNACDMFIDKMKILTETIKQYNPKTIADYGAGLGITTLLLKEAFPNIEITYVDFKSSHQCKFFQFLLTKLNLPPIKVIDVEEFMAGNEWYETVLAMDCFEHIPNLDETLKSIARQTNIIVHDSSFEKNIAQPQHVNDKGHVWFINLMVKNNFMIPERDWRVFRKYCMTFEEKTGLAMAFYHQSNNTYEI